MIFKRRNKPSWKVRLREALLPRKGWSRGLEYMGHRVRRIPDTPHKIAIGAAMGVFMVFSPLFGLHILLAMFLAYLLRGNVLAALITTWFGNPVTYPFVAAGSLKLGTVILGNTAKERSGDSVMLLFEHAMGGIWSLIKSWFGFGEANSDGLSIFFYDIFLPYLIGGIILGAVFATLMYFVSKPLIGIYQMKRREQMAERRQRRLQARQSEADSGAQADYPSEKPE